MNQYKNLFEPIEINGLTLENRLVMIPMGTNFGEQNGEMSFLHINYYEQRAKGGTGLIIVENASVFSPQGSNGTSQLRIDHDSYLPRLYKLCERVHKYGTKIAIQINSPINKTRISYNLINTKTAKMYSKIKDRTQVTLELLKNPSFRIYFSHSDINLYNKVKTFLEEGKNYYTLSMGLSEFISEFDYISEIDLKEINNKHIIKFR